MTTAQQRRRSPATHREPAGAKKSKRAPAVSRGKKATLGRVLRATRNSKARRWARNEAAKRA